MPVVGVGNTKVGKAWVRAAAVSITLGSIVAVGVKLGSGVLVGRGVGDGTGVKVGVAVGSAKNGILQPLNSTAASNRNVRNVVRNCMFYSLCGRKAAKDYIR